MHDWKYSRIQSSLIIHQILMILQDTSGKHGETDR